jgi:pyridoxine 5-phosphate synthase
MKSKSKSKSRISNTQAMGSSTAIGSSLDRRFRVPRLGVNIDHIATLRQLRGTPYPDLMEAARIVERAGAHQITVHLREDRRHIQDADVFLLKRNLKITLNLEMSISPEIVKIAHRVNPDWVCLVPEKRQEVTTEGGLNVQKHKKTLAKIIQGFKKKKIKVSLFIEPDQKTVELAHALGADAVELHTGRYCMAAQKTLGKKSAAIEKSEFKRIQEAALAGHAIGIHVHAGHGFDLLNVRPVVALDLIEEYNIGHAIVCRAAIVGLDQAVREMLAAVQAP